MFSLGCTENTTKPEPKKDNGKAKDETDKKDEKKDETPKKDADKNDKK